jgi:hypothetical protein
MLVSIIRANFKHDLGLLEIEKNLSSHFFDLAIENSLGGGALG